MSIFELFHPQSYHFPSYSLDILFLPCARAHTRSLLLPSTSTRRRYRRITTIFSFVSFIFVCRQRIHLHARRRRLWAAILVSSCLDTARLCRKESWVLFWIFFACSRAFRGVGDSVLPSAVTAIQTGKIVFHPRRRAPPLWVVH